MARQVFNDIWANGGSLTDPGTTKWSTGWIAEKPPFQYFNFWMNKIDQMLQHVERFGIPVWNAATVYQVNGICQGSDGALYQAVASSTNVNPVGTVVAPSYATSSWKRLDPPSTESAAGIIEIATTLETTTLTDDTRAVTPKKLNDLAASTTQKGISKFATGVQAAALSDATVALTPNALNSVIATSALKGLVQLASAAEVLAGTVSDKAVTPDTLGTLGQSLIANGYKKFPGGLIVNWGNITLASSELSVALAQPYGTAHLAAFASADTTPTGAHTGTPAAARPHDSTPLTHIKVKNDVSNNVNLYWLSLGK